MLTSNEQADFETIISGARSVGWLHETERVTAKRVPSGVLVEADGPLRSWRKRYADDARWLYELLRDLAEGIH
jgi:hypothetical protein